MTELVGMCTYHESNQEAFVKMPGSPLTCLCHALYASACYQVLQVFFQY